MTQKIGIIGGGIVGSTAAYYLTKENQNVTLIDSGVGQATSAAAGIISPWLSQRRNKEWYFLAKEGAKFYQTLIHDLSEHQNTDHVYQQTGTLLYKNTPVLLEKLKTLAETRKIDAPEIGNVNHLSYSEIKERIADINMTDDALFVSGGAKIDGAALTQLLKKEVVRLGNQSISDIVQSISYKNNQWEVITHQDTFIFDQLILACGAWIGDLLRPLDFHVDIRPQKGQLIEIKITSDTKNWPVLMPVGETDIIPFDDGKILIGATHENDKDYDLSPDNELLGTLKKEAQNFISTIDENATVVGSRVGTRAYTSDFLPFFGEIDTLPQLLVASGLGSSGLTTGPIIGKTLADWVLEKETSFEDYRSKPNQYIYPN